MLRAAFISLSKAQWARHVVTRWKIAWRVASRFVAGNTLDEALKVVQQLNQAGFLVTLDPLGENSSDRASAAQAMQQILDILDEINRHELTANVSVKLTQLGLLIDREWAYSNLLTILTKARERGNFVRVDMEDSSLTQSTLEMVERAYSDGFDNTGVVLQSYLYRSEQDARRMVELGIPVRLVKGAYKEPSNLAFPRKKDVDGNYDRLAGVLIAGVKAHPREDHGKNGRFPSTAAFATHDSLRVKYALDSIEKAGLSKSSFEFQMLYGIRRELQKELIQKGYTLRVYVPFGQEWYPYFMRRLAERPANVWFFISNFFQR